MFPTLNEESDNPSDFWGGAEVPPYNKIQTGNSDDSVSLAEKIRKIGKDCTGYIQKNEIFFHIISEKKYYTDFYRDFVFICFKDMPFTGNLPHGYLLIFLLHKSKKTLLIYENDYFLIEKTDETYSVCTELDKIYFNIDFFERNIISKKDTMSIDDIIDTLFLKLITEYLQKKGISDFNPPNDFYILTNILKLRVA